MADDHYEVLEISRTASPEMVHKAYRFLMAVHHPDQGGNPERARAVNEAYDVLKDADKRQAYDQQLALSEAPVAGAGRGMYDDPEFTGGAEESDDEPSVDWGAEVPVEEHAPQDVPVWPTPPEPPPRPGNPFPWEPGGPEPAPGAPPASAVPKQRRPRVNLIAGVTLVVLSLLPLSLGLVFGEMDNVVSTVGCFAVLLVVAWISGRGRAAGGAVGVVYPLYVGLVLIVIVATYYGARGQDMQWMVLYEAAWWIAYVTFVESSRVWRRRGVGSGSS